jgi:hypothetical protein
MKLIRVSLAAVLALGVAASVPALAQHDDHGRDSRHDNGKGKGQVRHEEHQVRHEEHQVRHEEHQIHHEEHQVRQEEHQIHHEQEVRRVEFAENHHRRISDEHFRTHFGREHRFRIEHPVIVAGHPRFQYGGYWFAIARPLPPGWRYTDEVYVDHIGEGYYMCSPVHPGIRISINIL